MTTLNESLKPCPKCSGKANLYFPFHMMGNRNQPATYRAGVQCSSCGFEERATTPPDQAIYKWNSYAREAKKIINEQPAPMQVDSTDAEGELRRVFEKWHDKEVPNDSLLRHVAGYYADHSVNNRWKAVWAVCSTLASRAEHAVPEGYVLVPIEPTEDMIFNMCVAHEFSPYHDIEGPMKDAYGALIYSLPTSNTGE